MELYKLVVQKMPAGVVLKEECWICSESQYLYSSVTFEGLMEILKTEWRHEKHKAY